MSSHEKTETWQLNPLAVGVSIAALISAVSFPVYAQEIAQQKVDPKSEEVTSSRIIKKSTDIEEVVVTGSRLRRSTFSSVSPSASN